MKAARESEPGFEREIGAELRRLVRVVRREVAALPEDTEARIHAIRTGMKRARAWLRLRPGKASRAPLDAAMRQLKDVFAAPRDALVRTRARERWLGRKPAAGATLPLPAAISRQAEALAERVDAGVRALDWPAPDRAALLRRWEEECRREQRAARRAARDGGARRFHRWRARAKVLAYQGELLSPLAGRVSRETKRAHRLGVCLGHEHDLTLLLARRSGLTKKQRRRLRRERALWRECALRLRRRD